MTKSSDFGTPLTTGQLLDTHRFRVYIPDTEDKQITVAVLKEEIGGVSTDADNVLEAGADGKPFLDVASIGDGGGAVASVNGASGVVVLDHEDVGAASAAHTHAIYAPLAGATYTGPVVFSGTTNSGLKVNNLTTAQISALTAARGQIEFDTTTDLFKGYDGADWIDLGQQVSGGSGDIDVATAAHIRAGTAGLKVVTPAGLVGADAAVALTLAAGNVAISATAFRSAATVDATSNVDFNTVAGLTARKQWVYVTANGAARTITGTGFDVTSNIDTGAVIADGDTGIFAMFRIGGLDWIVYEGSEDYLISGGVADASTTAKGIAEASIASEVNTGTDTLRYVSPDSLAGSYAATKVIEIEVFAADEDVVVGDGAARFYASSDFNGMDLVRVAAYVDTAGTTGTTDVQIHNVTDAVDVLSTKITIDSGETSTATAAAAAVINTSNDAIATNDKWRIDVDATSTTEALGLVVVLEFRLP